jgi:hypothetical protein
MTITVRLLEASDDRSGFSSGNLDLDRFFQRFAGQNQFDITSARPMSQLTKTTPLSASRRSQRAS